MNEAQSYTLDSDGPLFRRQRELLLRLADAISHDQVHKRQPNDEVLLEGLLLLTEANENACYRKPEGRNCQDDHDGRLGRSAQP